MSVFLFFFRFFFTENILGSSRLISFTTKRFAELCTGRAQLKPTVHTYTSLTRLNLNPTLLFFSLFHQIMIIVCFPCGIPHTRVLICQLFFFNLLFNLIVFFSCPSFCYSSHNSSIIYTANYNTKFSSGKT